MPSLVLSVLNVLIVFAFILRFKRKIDFVVNTTKQDSDDQEEKEKYVALHTFMVQNIPRLHKVHKTE